MIEISFNSCRICLKGPSACETLNSEVKSIDDRDEHSTFSYSEKFTMCTGINISTDILLAKKICNQCAKTLRDSFSFLVTCKKTEIILQNYIHDVIKKDEESKIPPKVLFETPGLNDRAETLLKQDIWTSSSTTPNIINKNENIEFLSVNKFEAIYSDDGGNDIYNENPIIDNNLINNNEDGEDIDENNKKLNKKYKSQKSKNKLKEGNTKLNDTTTFISNKEKKPRSRRKLKIPKLKEPETPIICDICGNFYKDRKQLEFHRHLHTGEKNFKCSICDRGFALRSYLTGHMLTHTGVRKFQCSFCEKKFYRACVMRLHEKKHNLQRDFECQICNKKFKLSNYLKRHMRIHNDERPYNCKLCGVSFRRDHHLKQHIRTRAHRDLMAKPSQTDLQTQTLKIEPIPINASTTAVYHHSLQENNNQFV